MLRPHDVLCLLKICCLSGKQWSFHELSMAIGVSHGEAYNSFQRLKESLLISEKASEGRKSNMGGAAVRLSAQKFVDFLAHGVPVAFYQRRGPIVRGMLTSSFAPPLCEKLPAEEGAVPLVWPTPNGKARGETLEPLCKSAPTAAAADPRLYELLALVDALRAGRGKERKLALEILEQRLLPIGASASE